MTKEQEDFGKEMDEKWAIWKAKHPEWEQYMSMQEMTGPIGQIFKLKPNSPNTNKYTKKEK